MNAYSIIIIAALLVNFFTGLVADLLNLRCLNSKMPEEFKDVYDESEYERSQNYTRVKTRFGIISSTFALLVLFVFWHARGFQWLDETIRRLDFGPIVTGLIYITILSVGAFLVSLPFSVYSTFVIEERFGFNRMKPRTFVYDILKGFALALVFGLPLLAVVLLFFEKSDSYAWLWVWSVVALFSLVLQYLAPRVIMPLFNKFDPLENDSLKHEILKYASSVRFKLGDVYKMDGSKRSSKSNAFFTGFGKNRRVVLFDTLIDQQPVPQLVTILAHEIGHYKKRHIPQQMVISFLHMGILLFLLSIFLRSAGLFEAFYMKQVSVYAGLIFFSLLYTPVELLVSIPMQMLSRKFEFQADAFAVETTRMYREFKAALKSLAAKNLSNLAPHPFYVFLNYSHPPLVDRIKAIENLEK